MGGSLANRGGAVAAGSFSNPFPRLRARFPYPGCVMLSVSSPTAWMSLLEVLTYSIYCSGREVYKAGPLDGCLIHAAISQGGVS